MDTSSTPQAPLFNAFMQDLAKQLVPLVMAEITTTLKAQTNAESMGMIALDPNNISLPVYTLLSQDTAIRETIRDLISDQVSDIDLSDFRDFRDLVSKVDDVDAKIDDIDFDDLQGKIATLEEKVGELEENSGTKIDADDSDFSDAVLQVLRNTI